MGRHPQVQQTEFTRIVLKPLHITDKNLFQ